MSPLVTCRWSVRVLTADLIDFINSKPLVQAVQPGVRQCRFLRHFKNFSASCTTHVIRNCLNSPCELYDSRFLVWRPSPFRLSNLHRHCEVWWHPRKCLIFDLPTNRFIRVPYLKPLITCMLTFWMNSANMDKSPLKRVDLCAYFHPNKYNCLWMEAQKGTEMARVWQQEIIFHSDAPYGFINQCVWADRQGGRVFHL